MPRWVNWAIDRLADAPMSPLGRLAALRYGRPDSLAVTPTTRFRDKPIRVLIAPVNYSGQGKAWANALEYANDSICAQNMSVEVKGGFAFDTDLEVPISTYQNDPSWQERQFQAASSATHVLIEAEEPPFGRLMGRSVEEQASALTQNRVNVAFIAHGTDARLPSRHIEANPLSYYSDPAIYLPRAEKVAARNIAMLKASNRPVFVSTPDLLSDLPKAIWCPVTVDTKRWTIPREPREAGQPLRVAHAPSVAAYKGTQLIIPVLERLQKEGVIDFTLIQGVPSTQMPHIFSKADVVLDQFRAGSYGVAACEAMATGCIVVGQVSQQVRNAVHSAVGVQLPIVEANPDSLEEVLRELALSSSLETLRERSVNYVEQVHSGSFAASSLLSNWITPEASASSNILFPSS